MEDELCSDGGKGWLENKKCSDDGKDGWRTKNVAMVVRMDGR